MAARAKKQTWQYASASIKQPLEMCKVPTFRPGDVIRVQLFASPTEPHSTLLIRAERCDDRHQILYGTIVSESFGLSRALDRGAKLAVAYHLVRENVHIVSFRGVQSGAPSNGTKAEKWLQEGRCSRTSLKLAS